MTTLHQSHAAHPQGPAERAQYDISFALRTGDPFTMYGLLEALDLKTRESAELIFSFVMLRARGLPADDLNAWAARATSYLRRVAERTTP